MDPYLKISSYLCLGFQTVSKQVSSATGLPNFTTRTSLALYVPSALSLDYKGKKVKWFRYRPGVAQRVGRGIALLFLDRCTRRGWVVSSTPRLQFTPGKDPVPILQEAGWAVGPVWTGGKSRPHRDSIPDRPALSSVAIPSELPGPHP